jgi:surface polysaccharide O-acyltransferase-like enzyme
VKTSDPSGGDRIAFLDDLRLIGIVMVVGVHALGRANLDQPIEEWFRFVVTTIAVPIFFLVDGFLFARTSTSNHEFSYKSYVVKSYWRLLLPWIVFSLLYTCLRGLLESRGLLSEQVILGHTPQGIAAAIYLSMVAPQMYFLLSLFIIRLGTILYRRIVTMPSVWIVIVCLLYTFIFRNSNAKAFFYPGADPILLALWGLQFYFLGIVLFRLHHIVSKIPIWVMSAGFGLLLILKQASASPGFIQYSYLLAVYGLGLAIADRFTQPLKIARYNMGIYLLHTPIVLTVISIGMAIVLSPASILYYVLVTLATVAVSGLLAKFILAMPYISLILGERMKPFPPVLSEPVLR